MACKGPKFGSKREVIMVQVFRLVGSTGNHTIEQTDSPHETQLLNHVGYVGEVVHLATKVGINTFASLRDPLVLLAGLRRVFRFGLVVSINQITFHVWVKLLG